jgi:hypothetical protein
MAPKPSKQPNKQQIEVAQSPSKTTAHERRIGKLRVGAEGRPPYPLGRVQRVALRLLRRADGPISTLEIQRSTHGKRRRQGQPLGGGTRAIVLRALDRFADRVGRQNPGGILWLIKPEFRR